MSLRRAIVASFALNGGLQRLPDQFYNVIDCKVASRLLDSLLQVLLTPGASSHDGLATHRLRFLYPLGGDPKRQTVHRLFHPGTSPTTPRVLHDPLHLHQLDTGHAPDDVAGRFIDAVPAPVDNLLRFPKDELAEHLLAFALPRHVCLGLAAQVARVMVSDPRRETPGQLQLALFEQLVEILGDMQHLELHFLAQERIDRLHDAESAGARDNHSGRAGCIPVIDVAFGELDELPLKTHLEGAAAAARLLAAPDAHVNSSLLAPPDR